jgi:hypothetical protein
VGEGKAVGLLIGLGTLSVCGLIAWVVLWRPVRQIVEDVRVEHARALFHQQREWLEARFITTLARADAAEGRRWEAAHWHDEVLWARDRKTRRLLALVCVHFEPDPFEVSLVQRHATALFEFCGGRWKTDGKRLDEMRPADAVARDHRFEAVFGTHPQPPQVR